MSLNLDELTKNNVKKAYHFYAPIYDFIFGATLEPGRKALAKEVAKIQPQSILEIGVGTGIMLDQYPINSYITGIDISKDMLKIAEEKACKLSNMKIALKYMDAENLAFEDNSFDCVALPYVLSVTPNPQQLVSEVRRVCRKNGHIIIVNHFSGSGFWWFLEKLVKNFAEKIGFHSEFSYKEHVLAYDWQVVNMYSVNLFGLSKLVVIKNA